jgi:hypothetical protein
MIVTGSMDVPEFSALSERLERDIRHAEREVLVAAHLVSMEQPEEFSRLSADFISLHSGRTQ